MVKKNRADNFKGKGFKKGQSGNPLGGKLHNPELRALKQLSQAQLVEIGNIVIQNDYETLQKMVKDNKLTVLQRIIASMAMKAIETGNTEGFDKIILHRFIGKVPDAINHSGIPAAPAAQVVVMLPDNGRGKK